MDVTEIRKLEKVVERLAARGPTNERGPHCWFCGKVEAWFHCDCPDARAAQQGKRNKPRWDAKRNVIVLDEDIIKRNEAWGFKRATMVSVVPLTPVHAPTRQPRVDKSVDNRPATVDSVDTSAPPVDSAAARRAYKAAHERSRRAKAKQDTPEAT